MQRSLALTLMLLASTASAEKLKLAVLDPWAPPNLSGIAVKVGQDILAAARKEPDYEVLDPATVERALGTEALHSLQACLGKMVCVTSHSGNLQADRLVVGLLDRNENSYLVKLQLIDLKTKSVISSIDRSILIASRRLQADVSAAIPRLLEGKAEAKGTLSIATSSPGAALVLDGEPAGKTPLTLEVKPGKHTVKVTKANFLPVERFVTVEAGATEQVSLLMTPVPGSRPEDELMAAKKQEKQEGMGGISIPAGSWILAGGAVLAGGASVYFGLHASALQGKAGDQSGGNWSISRAEALDGKRSAMIANLGIGVASAAALGAVVYALLAPSEPAKPAAPAVLLPVPGGAAVALSGSF